MFVSTQEAFPMQKAIQPSPRLRSRWILSLLTVIAAILLSSATGWAQSTQGSILGTVKDSKGAVIPDAAVTLTDTEEGVQRTTKTSGSGEYFFSDAKASHYKVEIESPSFEKWETSGVVLEVRQQLRLDAVLAVGSIQQEVTVNSDTESAIQ